jgi:hypothetical protein
MEPKLTNTKELENETARWVDRPTAARLLGMSEHNVRRLTERKTLRVTIREGRATYSVEQLRTLAAQREEHARVKGKGAPRIAAEGELEARAFEALEGGATLVQLVTRLRITSTQAAAYASNYRALLAPVEAAPLVLCERCSEAAARYCAACALEKRAPKRADEEVGAALAATEAARAPAALGAVRQRPGMAAPEALSGAR